MASEYWIGIQMIAWAELTTGTLNPTIQNPETLENWTS